VRLTDIMSNADLAVWPQVAMVIFLGVFFLVVVRTLTTGRRSEMRRRAAMALDDGPTTDNSNPSGARAKEAMSHG